MLSITGFFSYLVLFLGLCGFVIVVISCWNILIRSYRFQNALVVLIPILIVLVVMSFLSVINLLNIFGRIQESGVDNFWVS
jgi:glucan phosphoethanolaminetransferase (alkaline phosphatase superfamily)